MRALREMDEGSGDIVIDPLDIGSDDLSNQDDSGDQD
jgi:hypothetical protein